MKLQRFFRALNTAGRRHLQGKTVASRRKFTDINHVTISLHKPHLSTIVKIYVIGQIKDHLKEIGKINMINSLKYRNYTATIQYNSEDVIFFGRVIGISDLITFEGASVKELKSAFQEAIGDYIETCKHLD